MAWYNASWNYREAITVTNSSGGTLTNYQVKLTLNTAALVTASKMQSAGQEYSYKPLLMDNTSDDLD